MSFISNRASSVMTRKPDGSSTVVRSGAGSKWSGRVRVEEHRDVQPLGPDESDWFQRGRQGLKILSADEQVDISGVPDRTLVDCRDPRRDRMVADDRIRYASRIEGRRGP
jgi:hypothetical protein